jgi:hypothetical protein
MRMTAPRACIRSAPDAKRRISEFLGTEVENYLIPDLERLTNEVRPEGKAGLRACSVPLALFCFAIVDYFGFLMRSDERNPDKRKTEKNIRWLFVESGRFPVVYSKSSRILVRLFRHGIAHQCFPKACGLGKCGPKHPLFFVVEGALQLNVDVLAKDVLKFLQQLKTDIAADDESAIAVRMDSRLTQLNQEDHREAEELNREYQ